MVRAFLIVLTLFSMVQLTGRSLPAQTTLRIPRINSGEQWLVLNNGGLVEGFVQRQREHYQVQTRTGSRLIISFDDASFVCGSLEEAYWGKLARTKATDQAGQIALFRWCIQQQLPALAENQFTVLKSLKIAPLEMEFLERQLVATQQASREPQHQRSLASLADSSGLRPTLEDVAPVFSPLPSIQTEPASVIRQVAYEAPLRRAGEKKLPDSREVEVPAETNGGDMFRREPQPPGMFSAAARLKEEHPSNRNNQPLTSSTTETSIDRLPPATITRPGSLAEPARLMEFETRNAQPLNAVATSAAMPLTELPPLSEATKSASASSPAIPRLQPLSPLGNGVGEIPQLNSRPTVFRPRDEFDPEIFNREFFP